MKNNRKQCLVAIILLVFVLISQLCTVAFADGEKTEIPGTEADEIQTPSLKVEFSDKKIPAEPFNRTNAGLFFAKNGDKTSSKFCFFMRVEKTQFESNYPKFDDFKTYGSIRLVYREKGAEGEDGYKVIPCEIVSRDNATEGGVDYVYFTLNVYDGGLKELTIDKTYEIVANFYENTETTEKLLICSTNTMEVTYTGSMYVSWKEFFVAKSGTSLEEGKIKNDSFSLFDILRKPMGWVLAFFYNLIPNYLVAIILFTIVIKIILFFATGIKQQKNMVKQAMFAPKQRAIQNKYKGRTDRETVAKMQQEIQEAQQNEGINPLGGGCLGMVIQMLIVICLYNVIRDPLTYLAGVPSGVKSVIKQYFIDFKGIKCDDISVIRPLQENFEAVVEFLKSNFAYDLTKDVTAAKLPNFILFKGFDMGATPTLAFNLLILVPILVFVSYYFSMKLTRKFSYQPPKIEGAPDTAKSMAIMDIAMPALSTFICFSVPALLGIYWIFQSLLGVVQQFILKKMYPFPEFTEEDYKAAEREYKGKQPKGQSRTELLSKKSKYDDSDEVYAELPDTDSYYDLSEEERKNIDSKMKTKAQNMTKSKDKSKKSSIIGKAELNDDSSSDKYND